MKLDNTKTNRECRFSTPALGLLLAQKIVFPDQTILRKCVAASKMLNILVSSYISRTKWRFANKSYHQDCSHHVSDSNIGTNNVDAAHNSIVGLPLLNERSYMSRQLLHIPLVSIMACEVLPALILHQPYGTIRRSLRAVQERPSENIALESNPSSNVPAGPEVQENNRLKLRDNTCEKTDWDLTSLAMQDPSRTRLTPLTSCPEYSRHSESEMADLSDSQERTIQCPGWHAIWGLSSSPMLGSSPFGSPSLWDLGVFPPGVYSEIMIEIMSAPLLPFTLLHF
jgi:hypothetical protein